MLNNNFILLVILITGLVSGYFYYSNLSSEIFIAPVPNEKIDDLNGFASLSLDASSLKQDRINSLRIFGEYPVSPGAIGKRNLFGPI